MKHKKTMIIIIPIIVILLVIFGWLVALKIIISNFKPTEGSLPVIINSEESIKQGQLITIMTWNLGYGGLGEESNFIADGGKSILPPSKTIVANNMTNITTFIQQNPVNIFLLQEVSKRSRLTYNLDLWQMLINALPNYNRVHSPTVKIPWFPIIGRLITGNAVFSNIKIEEAFRCNLPLENKGLLGVFKQRYNFIVSRYDLPETEKQLVMADLHLAAFDEGGLIRKNQLSKLQSFMLKEYEKGNYVVVGGDWNHRLIKTDFPTTTEEKYLFWIHNLPEDFTPDGWQWALDENVPTVRTLERSYIINENYTCIIDGFLLSPNLELLSVQGFNQQFRYSDHNPIKIEIRPKGI